MKPTYEKIEVTPNTSFKVGVYHQDSLCPEINWHFHPEYEIVYIKNGKCNVQIDKYASTYDNGVLLFLGPHTPHMPFGNNDNSNQIEVVIQFDTNFIENKLSIFPEFSKIISLINLSKKGIIFHPSVKEKTASLFEKFESLDPAESLLNVFQILLNLAKTTAFDTINKNDFSFNYQIKDFERINYVFNYVSNSYDKELSTRIIAQKIGLTTNSFCRLFKKTTHKTFTQFINEYRIQKAIDFLEEGKYSVSDVMYKCGYNDLSYFSKQFKRNRGISPSKYLKITRQSS